MANKQDLKGFLRYDASGRVIPGSLVLRKKKPKFGKYFEVPADEVYQCCTETSTTTTTSTSTSTTTTSTSTSTTTTTTTVP
jgi:hypothetical protein